MLQIKDVTITHRKDLKDLIRDCSFSLRPSDKAVLIGEEGNGKSTLLKWIYDPSLIEDYADVTGSRILTGEKLGYLAQELPPENRDQTVYDYFTKDLSFFDHSPGELAALARRTGLDLDVYYREQPMKTLSGGEKVKVQLLKMLLENPTILLLDEPSNDLDLETLTLLEQLILDFRGIVLFISHDEVLIENTANVVVHLEQVYQKRECRLQVARMSYPDYVRMRQDLFVRQEELAANDLRQKRIRDEKYRRIYEKVEHAQAVITRQDPPGGRLLKKKMHAVKAMGARFAKEDEQMTDRPIREEAIDFSFGELASPIPSGKTVLDYQLDALCVPGSDRLLSKDIRLVVRGPEKVGIIGKNGAGKTTLLRLIAEALLQREDISAIYMPQQYEDQLDPEKTPVDYLVSGTDLRKVRITDPHASADQRRQLADAQKENGPTEKMWRTHVETYLAALRFTLDEMSHSILALSGGQKAKLFLLKMTLSPANVLILDEPTRNFSPLSGPVIRNMLASFPGAIISISHDRKYLTEVCDTLYHLDDTGLHLDVFSRLR